MTRQETLKIMAVLKGAYPNYYRGMSKDELEGVVNLWAELFREEPYELVAGAVKRLIASDVKGFPPVIGQIKEQIYQLTHPMEMTEQEAWSLVSKAVRDFSYYAPERDNPYYRLPEMIQRLLRPEDIKAWAMSEEDEFQTVIASNFMRSYRARMQSQKELDKLPPPVRGVVELLGGKMRLHD